jgi:CubicO group peptidase (beta-lactamase class C family)
MQRPKLLALIGAIGGVFVSLALVTAGIRAFQHEPVISGSAFEERENPRDWLQVTPTPGEHRMEAEIDKSLTPAEVDSLILYAMSSYRIPGVAACAVKDGRIIWTGSYGYAIIERDIPVADTTLFMLASISKTFTGAALLQLWEAGLFGLDDDINDYLPFTVFNPNHPDSVITFRSLLTHTSSIKDNWDVMYAVYVYGDSPIPLGEYVEGYLTPGGEYYSATANFYTWAPEHGWSYCNEAFALVAYLVEIISGIPFDQYCNDSLFTPLGMYETSWFLADLDTNNVAMPYHYSGGTYVPQGYYGYADYPAGQLRTSSIQLARHLLAFLQMGEIDGVRILDSTTVEEMTIIQYPEIYSYQGLVWFHNYTGGRWVWRHGGGDAGVATLASCCFDENSAVVVLTNGESHSATGLITNILFDYAASYSLVVGDANGDGVTDPGDVVFLINYLFRGGSAPVPYEAGDCNCDEVVNADDVVYLISYLFRGGPPPCES